MRTPQLRTIPYIRVLHNIVQWNLSNPDTNGAEESVIVSEVSSFQRLKAPSECSSNSLSLNWGKKIRLVGLGTWGHGE